VSCFKNDFAFFQINAVMFRNVNGKDRAVSGSSGLFMKLWPILEDALNCTQVFGVVCLSMMIVFHTIQYRKQGWWRVLWKWVWGKQWQPNWNILLRFV